MNRAERRRQQKRSPKRSRSAGTSDAYQKGAAHHQSGRLNEAVHWYRKALMESPNNPQALSNLGLALQCLGELEAAAVSLQKAIRLKPDYAIAYKNLGVTFQAQGKWDEAAACYGQAASIHPGFVDSCNSLAVLFIRQGRLQQAVELLQKSVAIQPGFAMVHNNLGVALNSLGRNEAAVVSYQNALAIQPAYPEACNNLGNAYGDLGRLNLAAASYQKALSIKPDYADAYSNLGAVLQHLGQLEGAVANFVKALSINPSHTAIYSNLNLTLQSMCWQYERNRHTIDRLIDQLSDSHHQSPEPDIIRHDIKILLSEETAEDKQMIAEKISRTDQGAIGNSHYHSSESTHDTKEQPSRDMVALLHFGRSGSGYLHSCLDGHPNISTLPGVYMSGFFGRGVWNSITREGFQGVTTNFSNMYDVLFDATSKINVPAASISDDYGQEKGIGMAEGFDRMGENRNQALGLDRTQFISTMDHLIGKRKDIDQASFFDSIHQAFETVLGNDFSEKKAVLYHMHKLDTFSMCNFLKYYPKAKILLSIREPLQSCESWVGKSLLSKRITQPQKRYFDVVKRVGGMLTLIDSREFASQSSAAIRLEDIKKNPKETMRRLCLWLGVEESPSLYESTMQGLKWWGDPSSALFGKTQTLYDREHDPINVKRDRFFSDRDRHILGTLFHPFSVRFGYEKSNPERFRNNLKQIHDLLDKPLDFEQRLARDFTQECPDLENSAAFHYFHAILHSRWRTLDRAGTYHHMPDPLPELPS